MNNKVTKRTITKEFTEFIIKCEKCDKEIIGSSESQVVYNLKIHQLGKGCKHK